MKAGSFILNGISSEDLHTVIQSRPVLETPKRRVQFKQAFGQSGSTPYDEEAYDNTELPLILYTDGPDAVTSREAIYEMFNSGKYIDLKMYCDDSKIYKVMTIEPPKFESRYYMGEGMSYEVLLTVLPYKYLIDSPLATFLQSGSIFNPMRYNSLPIIKVYGSGDIVLNVNGIPFSMKGVSSYITLDSKFMFAYKDTGGVLTNENSKIYTREYPYLKPGVNTISWTGTVTKVEILPRWRSLT